MKIGLACIACAAVISVAVPASATVLLATVTGVIEGGYDGGNFFNPHPDFGENGANVLGNNPYVATIRIDTAIGQRETTASSDRILADGGASPILAVTFVTKGREVIFGGGPNDILQEALFEPDPGGRLDGLGYVEYQANGPNFALDVEDFGPIVTDLDGSLALGDSESVIPGLTFDFGFFNTAAPTDCDCSTTTFGTLSVTSFSVVPVPEPATWVLLLAGFGVCGVVARRRSAASRPPLRRPPAPPTARRASPAASPASPRTCPRP
jgi:hypothetical protein